MIPDYAWPFPHPWEECGEIFYGWMDPSWVAHDAMDFSIPRRCNYPKDHRSGHNWCPIVDAGQYPRREYRYEMRARLRREAIARRWPTREAVQ
jgi:hypothetical protein